MSYRPFCVNEGGTKDGNEGGTMDGNEGGNNNGNEGGTNDGNKGGTNDGNEGGTNDGNEGGSNDGNEFKLQNGQYVNAKTKRQGKSHSSDQFRATYNNIAVNPGLSKLGYEGHKPDPALYVPLSQRREFLLANGKRSLLLSRDMETQYNGTMIWGSEGTSIIVRELFGDEKSEPFRP